MAIYAERMAGQRSSTDTRIIDGSQGLENRKTYDNTITGAFPSGPGAV